MLAVRSESDRSCQPPHNHLQKSQFRGALSLPSRMAAAATYQSPLKWRRRSGWRTGRVRTAGLSPLHFDAAAAAAAVTTVSASRDQRAGPGFFFIAQEHVVMKLGSPRTGS